MGRVGEPSSQLYSPYSFNPNRKCDGWRSVCTLYRPSVIVETWNGRREGDWRDVPGASVPATYSWAFFVSFQCSTPPGRCSGKSCQTEASHFWPQFRARKTLKRSVSLIMRHGESIKPWKRCIPKQTPMQVINIPTPVCHYSYSFFLHLFIIGAQMTWPLQSYIYIYIILFLYLWKRTLLLVIPRLKLSYTPPPLFGYSVQNPAPRGWYNTAA